MGARARRTVCGDVCTNAALAPACTAVDARPPRGCWCGAAPQEYKELDKEKQTAEWFDVEMKGDNVFNWTVTIVGPVRWWRSARVCLCVCVCLACVGVVRVLCAWVCVCVCVCV